MQKPTSPPAFLARAALALGLLRATDARGFLRAARHIETEASRVGVAQVLAAVYGDAPEPPVEDEVTAARRRWWQQWQELGP